MGEADPGRGGQLGSAAGDLGRGGRDGGDRSQSRGGTGGGTARGQRAGTEWLLALFLWGGFYVMAVARPFAPLKFLGPYLGLVIVLGMFLEGSRSSVDSTLPRGIYPIHMIGRWLHVLLAGAAGLLPLRGKD